MALCSFRETGSMQFDVTGSARIRYWGGCVSRKTCSIRQVTQWFGTEVAGWVAAFIDSQEQGEAKGRWRFTNYNDRTALLSSRCTAEDPTLDIVSFIETWERGERKFLGSEPHGQRPEQLAGQNGQNPALAQQEGGTGDQQQAAGAAGADGSQTQTGRSESSNAEMSERQPELSHMPTKRSRQTSLLDFFSTRG